MNHERLLARGLVEMIVTVSAIALLAVWFAPAAANIRNDSKDAKCRANLAKIGFANAIYSSQDAGDAALPVHRLQFQQDPGQPSFIGAYEWGGKSGIGGRNETPATLYDSNWGTKRGFGPATRPLNKLIYGNVFFDHGQDHAGWLADTQLDLPVNECPADTGYTGVHFPGFRDSGLTSYDHFGTSYTANIFWISAGGGGSPMYSNSPYLHHMSEMKSPASTIAYQENNGRFGWAASPERPECQGVVGGNGIAGTVMGWHGQRWTFNTVFLDGHTDAIYMRGYSNPRLSSYPSLGGDAGTFDEDMCIIIRGIGWQKDTLPSDLVNTGLIAPGGGRSSYESGIQ
ncbi:MAG: hypothetical protein HY287_13565 [Planctomycetes bacterium]|nr:hypothetical protein [Planctomycetota bacterium]